MQKSSGWLIFTYIIVGVIIISSLAYSFNFTLKDLSKNKPGNYLTATSTSQVDSPNTYEFKIHQSKTIRGIVYTFNNVISDDRCAPNTECYSNNGAEIEMLIGGLGTSEVVHINTKDTTTYADLNFSIKELTPIPASTDNKETKVKLEIITIENPS